jgi:hypothetical protein
MTHEPDEGWKESPDPPKPSIDESVQMLQELADVKDAEKWEGAFNEIQTQLDEALTVAVDLQADVTRLTKERDLADAECHRLVTQEVDPERRARRKVEAERDALQERLRDKDALNKALSETARALRNGEEPHHYCAYCLEKIKTGGDPDHMLSCDKAPYGKLTQMVVDAHNLIEKLVTYTDDVVDIMRKVAEVIGDDDGPTADYGPAFCQLNRDGQRLLNEARAYLGEPTPDSDCDKAGEAEYQATRRLIEAGQPTPPKGDE